MIVGATPAAISLDAGQRVVVVCTSTPAPKFRKIAKPVSAAEGWCSGPRQERAGESSEQSADGEDQ
jgi:hypothetical protein